MVRTTTAMVLWMKDLTSMVTGSPCAMVIVTILMRPRIQMVLSFVTGSTTTATVSLMRAMLVATTTTRMVSPHVKGTAMTTITPRIPTQQSFAMVKTTTVTALSMTVIWMVMASKSASAIATTTTHPSTPVLQNSATAKTTIATDRSMRQTLMVTAQRSASVTAMMQTTPSILELQKSVTTRTTTVTD
eukprot:PhF_6_TR1929/c0_g1_i2/m.3006